MNRYLCEVSDEKGRIKKIIREDSSCSNLQSVLQNEGYYPVSIGLKSNRGRFARANVSKKTIIEFFSLISLLLDSGLSIKSSLGILKTITGESDVIVLSRKIEREINEGASFSISIEHLGTSLPQIYRSMLRICESTGDPASVIKKLNSYVARNKKMQDKLIGSLIYPMTVLLTALIGLILLSVLILPKLSLAFSESGSDIPVEVLKILLLSNIILNIILFGIPIVIILLIAIEFLGRKKYRIGRAVDSIIRNIPFLGSFIFERQLFSVLFSLDTLVSGGLTVGDAFAEVVEIVEARALEAALVRIYEKIKKGVDLSEAMFA